MTQAMKKGHEIWYVRYQTPV